MTSPDERFDDAFGDLRNYPDELTPAEWNHLFQLAANGLPKDPAENQYSGEVVHRAYKWLWERGLV